MATAVYAASAWHTRVLFESTDNFAGGVVISDKYIAWYESPLTSDYRPKVLDRTTGEIFDLSNVYDCSTENLAITNDWIIIEYLCDGAFNAVGAYNVNTHERIDIAPSSRDPFIQNGQPAADNNRVVWLRLTSQYDLFMFDFETRTTTQLTNNSAVESFPDVSGEWVVWDDFPNYDIHGLNIVTNEQVIIADDPARQEFPKIDGSLVVWEDARNGEKDVYGFDLATQSEIPIAVGPGYQRLPAPSGDYVSYGQFSYDENFVREHASVQVVDLTDSQDHTVYVLESNERFGPVANHHGTLVWRFEINDDGPTRYGLRSGMPLHNRIWLPLAFGE